MSDVTELRPGQIWRDKDPRCPNRLVEVKTVDEFFVRYRACARIYRSRKTRFQRAFRLVEDAPNADR